MKISEYVSVGHPDKVADYISEYILDHFLVRDPNVRYAVEVQIKDNHVTLGGEVTTVAATPNWHTLVKRALAEIGYTDEYCSEWGSENTIDPSKLCVEAHIGTQSPDIAQGVNHDGWGDQGIFWGMATEDEGPNNLPWDYYYAKDLCQFLYEESKNGAPWGIDIKTQIATDDVGCIKKVIVAAPCFPENVDIVESTVKDWLIDTGMPIDEDPELCPEIIVNGTGAYVKHASVGDCGTTGRKLAVDFYGGNCRIGGGSPWTKDPTKADLTLNLLARELAKIAVKERHIPVAYVSLGCCIGRPEIDVTIYDGHNNVLDSYTYKMGPQEVIERLNLRKPIYANLCMKGLWG
jgi:S-adenosylmethionine synthetase